jgi:hypothetical protein
MGAIASVIETDAATIFLIIISLIRILKKEG